MIYIEKKEYQHITVEKSKKIVLHFTKNHIVMMMCDAN